MLGVITGFIGTNTGGSVFLTVPVMIWLGIPPQSSIATARLASVGTMFAGLRHFHNSGKVDYRLAAPAAALGLAGALIGASLLVQIDPALVGANAGAKFALQKGDKWMESAFNVVVVALALKMLFW